MANVSMNEKTDNQSRYGSRSSSMTSSTMTANTDCSDGKAKRFDIELEAAFHAEAEAEGHYDESHPKISLEKLPTQRDEAQTKPQISTLTATLSRNLTRIRTADTIPLTPPPDGGSRAWITACLVHLVLFNTWGFVNSFGVFQTYYVHTLKIGSDDQVAWIGSFQVFILFIMGTFSGRATDAGFFKITFCIGSAIYIFGMFMLSLAKTYYQVFLAQAVCIGFGYGLVFVPSIALLSTYFLKKRSMALGIAVSGSATGGLVFPAIAETMLPGSYAWTIRTMAFVQMVGAVICAIFLKPRLPPRKTGPLVEWSAFKELPYTLYLIGSFFFFWGVYVGFFYVGTFGRTALGTSQQTSISLLLAMNGIGIIGRTIPNYFSDRYTGPLNMIMPFVGATGLLLYCWIAVDSVAGLWAFACMYGIAAAGIQGLFPVVLTSLTSNPKKLGVRSGMGFGIVGFAVLTGPPIAGALVQAMNGSFLGMQLFAGTTMMISLGFMIATRRARVGWVLKARV